MLDRLLRRLCLRKRTPAPGHLPAVCIQIDGWSLSAAESCLCRWVAFGFPLASCWCRSAWGCSFMARVARAGNLCRCRGSQNTAEHFVSFEEFPILPHTFSSGQWPLLCGRGSASHAISSKQLPWFGTYRPKFVFHTTM